MYIVTIENNGTQTEIHGAREKLRSGKVVKGINSIDTFSFSLLLSNPGFYRVHDFTTIVKVYNTNKDRYDFYGRVLYSDTTMDESGLITKDVTCESYFGYLCDSQQMVVGVQNWTVRGLLAHIIGHHNTQLADEPHKHFAIGEVTVTDPNDNLYCGIQYANTWETLNDKLVDALGGELSFRVVDGVTYIDYLADAGKHSTTKIALSHNMKSIKQERDPSAYITRLIPLGMKMGENDERLTIEEVNSGKNYIDDEYGIEQYGLHVGYHEWDDVTEAANLKTKAAAWLKENNRLQIKYSITALDLSLLGLDMDDFDVCNYHPIVNPLLAIDDEARIIKKSIDICEEVKSSIEIGDNFKTLSDIQISQAQQTAKVYSKITKTAEEIKLEVRNEIEGTYTELKTTIDGVTVTDPNGTTLIKGSSVDTTTLNVNNIVVGDGAITWGKLGVDVQNEINDAYAMAESAQSDAADVTELISSWQYNGGTYLDGDMIYSRSVYASALYLGGDLEVYRTERSTTLGGYLGFTTSALDNSAGMHMMSAEGYGEVVVTDNGAKLMYYDTDNQIYVSGDALGLELGGVEYLHIYANSDKAVVNGTWDFTNATVLGLSAGSTTAVFA